MILSKNTLAYFVATPRKGGIEWYTMDNVDGAMTLSITIKNATLSNNDTQHNNKMRH